MQTANPVRLLLFSITHYLLPEINVEPNLLTNEQIVQK